MPINWKRIHEVDENEFFINTPTKNVFLSKVKFKIDHKSKIPYICNYLYIGSIFYMFSDPHFYQAIIHSDSLHLDGFAIGKIAKLLYNKHYEDFTPKDFLYELLRNCEKENKKVYFLGSYPGNRGIAKAQKKIKADFNRLKIKGSSGFFTDSSWVVKDINKFTPDLLVVGMGLKNQERWIYQNKNKLKVGVIISAGNYLDILAGRVNPPRKIYQQLHIRWLRRVAKEPGRLWKRYVGGIFYLTLIFLNHYIRKAI